jgi:hypothetical protein
MVGRIEEDHLAYTITGYCSALTVFITSLDVNQ